MISENLLNKILDKKLTPQELSIDELSSFCKFANEKYRAGTPIITDADYDFLFLKELRNKDPDNKFLKSLNQSNGKLPIRSRPRLLPPQRS